MFYYILKRQKNISYLHYVMDLIISLILKGMRKMDYYFHPDYNTEKIRNFLDDLVHRKGYDDYSQFKKADKAEFASLLCEASGREEFACILEPENSDETIKFFRQALIGTKEDDNKFLHAIKNNAIHYYERTMAALFYHIYTYHISPDSNEPDPDNWPCSYEEIR
jgi:hypothetical protein